MTRTSSGLLEQLFRNIFLSSAFFMQSAHLENLMLKRYLKILEAAAVRLSSSQFESTRRTIEKLYLAQ
uniref:Uncharacterized protein n=1 Tax=Moniliophthora roreri TaxID=221103 RepID=A0A0W0FZH4_MONRR